MTGDFVIFTLCLSVFSTWFRNYPAFVQGDNESFILLSSIVPFFPLLLLIGGSILLTLSYVSWRKYRGNKLNKKRADRN